MPITQAEKEQLQIILAKTDADELVRIAGSIYDCVLKADLPTDKLIAVGKHLYGRVKWSDLPSGLNDARLKILRSAEENFLLQLPTLFTVSETPPPQAEEAPVEAPAAEPGAPPVYTVGESQVNEVVQIAKGTDGEMGAHEESIPDSEERQPPTRRRKEIIDLTPTITAEPENNTQAPENTAQGPEVIAQGPEVIAQGPDVIAQGPDVIAQGPDVIAEGSTNGASNGHVQETPTETQPQAIVETSPTESNPAD